MAQTPPCNKLSSGSSIVQHTHTCKDPLHARDTHNGTTRSIVQLLYAGFRSFSLPSGLDHFQTVVGSTSMSRSGPQSRLRYQQKSSKVTDTETPCSRPEHITSRTRSPFSNAFHSQPIQIRSKSTQSSVHLTTLPVIIPYNDQNPRKQECRPQPPPTTPSTPSPSPSPSASSLTPMSPPA